MWFTETPWPPIVLLALGVVGCGWMWLQRRQSRWIVGAIMCVAFIVGVTVLERAIVTPRERIAQNVVDLAHAFVERNEPQTLSFVSQNAETVRNQVKLGFATVTHVESLRISDVDVALFAAGSRAKSRFRANGVVEVRGFGNIGHKPTQWILTWQQEGGLWKVIDVQRLDPITGRPLDRIDARE